MTVRVQTADFDQSEELRILNSHDQIGAIVSFVGLVRGGDVASMTLEHYPGMTERALSKIEDDARQRWEIDGVTIIHRVGKLSPGDRIVFVAVGARHRRSAFEAAEFIMDFLKTDAPFWKKEERQGSGVWVDARDSDNSAAARWNSDRVE